MALQSSGQIKFSEIATETTAGATNNSLRSMSNSAGFVIQDAISEFYGYSAASNLARWEFANDAERLGFARTSGTVNTTGDDISVSMWVKVDWADSDTNSMLLMLSPDNSTTANRFFLMYDYGLNRIICRFRGNSINGRGTHFNLNSNSTQTGISSGKWHAGNRGNVNAGNFCHLAFTFDASAASGSAAFDMYWNGVKLTTKLTNLTSTMFNFNMNEVYINGSNNGTGNSRKSSWDNVAVFKNKLLTQTEITSLYNSGTSESPVDLSLDDNLMFVHDAETDPPTAVSGTDYTTVYNNPVDNGTKETY